MYSLMGQAANSNSAIYFPTFIHGSKNLMYSVGLHWHFFATSHGKGVVDGLGGIVKRTEHVWRYVRSGKGQATTPADFYELAVHRNLGIHLFYIDATSMRQNKGQLEERWKDTSPKHPYIALCYAT